MCAYLFILSPRRTRICVFCALRGAHLHRCTCDDVDLWQRTTSILSGQLSKRASMQRWPRRRPLFNYYLILCVRLINFCFLIARHFRYAWKGLPMQGAVFGELIAPEEVKKCDLSHLWHSKNTLQVILTQVDAFWVSRLVNYLKRVAEVGYYLYFAFYRAFKVSFKVPQRFVDAKAHADSQSIT